MRTSAAFAYYLYVAYAEEVAVEAERGTDRITTGGVLRELRQAAPVVPPVIVASVAAITVPTAATGLLVVPGLWLLTRWSLFAPCGDAFMIQRLGRPGLSPDDGAPSFRVGLHGSFLPTRPSFLTRM